jgi:MoxR-like ATPase
MLAARTGLSPVMVGRADELARLRELAAETGTGPAVALISGEAGIGKTRLVAELIATLDPALPVLAGQGSLEFVGAGPSVVCRGYPRQVSMNPFCGKGFMD